MKSSFKRTLSVAATGLDAVLAYAETHHDRQAPDLWVDTWTAIGALDAPQWMPAGSSLPPGVASITPREV